MCAMSALRGRRTRTERYAPEALAHYGAYADLEVCRSLRRLSIPLAPRHPPPSSTAGSA